MNAKHRFVMGGIVCCLLLTLAASMAMSAASPKLVWWEIIYGQNAGAYPGNRAGNGMGNAQLLIDGNTIIAEGQQGLLVYADEQKNGTAYVKSTSPFCYWWDEAYGPEFPGNSNYSTKGGTMLNGRLYSQDMKMSIRQGTLPNWDPTPVPQDLEAPWGPMDGPWGSAMATGRVESDSYGLVTDGTYLYGSDNPGAFAVGPAYIYKWSVDPAANNGNGALTEVWKVQIPTATWLISIGYYNGKLYAAEGFRGRNIYEIDCATGAYSTILSGDNLIPEGCGTDAWYMGQIARLGNRLVLANWTGHITQWVLTDGTWKFDSSYNGLKRDGYPEQFYGIGLKAGPDGNAKWAWVTGANIVYFFDLTPYSSKTDLADPYNWKNGYLAYVGDAVVTAVGTDGFWVENKKRTMGAHVLYSPTEAAPMPAKDALVSIKAVGGKSAAGERTLTASEVVVDGTFADLKPLFMTNKTLGPATGGAGLAADGMLVKVSGKLSAFDPSLFSFYMNDGSEVGNDTPNDVIAEAIKGLKVTKIDGSSFWGVTGITDYTNGTPSIATVVGIVRLQQLTDGTIIRRIDVVNDSDVTITPL